MKFVTVREFRANTATMRKELESEQQLVLTSNGRPFAMVTPVEPDTVMEECLAVTRARAGLALDRAAIKAGKDGRDAMTMDEIDAIIADVRQQRRRKVGKK